MKFDFITIGGATEDITFYTREGVVVDNKKDLLRQKLLGFEYGAKIKIDRSYSTFGGGAANAAVSLSRLGLKTAALIAVGNDSRGEAIIKNIKNNKINSSLIQIHSNFATGFSFLLAGVDSEHIVFSERGANTELEISKKEMDNFKKTDHIYMTSLSGNWKNVLNKIFSLPEIKIIWNPGYNQINSGIKVLRQYLQKTYVLSLNKDEAIGLALSDNKNKKLGQKINNMGLLLKIIKSFGPRIALITNGKHGANVFDGKNFYYQKSIKEKRRVNTTGVGDAFGSTFSAGLKLFNGDIKKAMFIAAKNASSVISHLGAQAGLLTKKELLKK